LTGAAADQGLSNVMGNRISTAAARKNFAMVVKRTAGGERIKLTRYDKTLAVLIPKKDLAVLEDCETDSPDGPHESEREPARASGGRRKRAR
jgi:antitoxin (DNA-binding transcriptional repressor) of toxin-antitoxin stability system